MLQIKDGQRVIVWEPKEAKRIKNTIEANVSSSKKNGENEWQHFSWNAKFVGRAYSKAQDLKSNDRIEIKEGALENYYSKEKEKLYVTLVIFDFEKIEAEEKA